MRRVFVSSDYYHRPTLAQLAGQVYPFLRWFNGRQSVVSPWEPGGRHSMFSPSVRCH